MMSTKQMIKIMTSTMLSAMTQVSRELSSPNEGLLLGWAVQALAVAVRVARGKMVLVVTG